MKIYTRTKADKNSAADLVLAKALQSGSNAELNIQILQNGFNRSDNWSFWQKNLPAICVSQDWEADFNDKNYHTLADTPETLNFDYMKRAALAITSGVNRLAQ